jgi:ribonucleotide reductase class II
VAWADLDCAQDIDLNRFSALAQFDFYMQVQRFYTQHNTSATIELREDEIEPLAVRIYESIQDDEGYVSIALLSRIDSHQSYPRLPFEPIDKDTYEDLMVGVKTRRLSGDFDELLAKYDRGIGADGSSASGCDSDKCLLG